MEIPTTRQVARHRSPAERKQILEQWQASGLSARAFAARAEIRPGNLWRWKAALVEASRPTTPGFVPVVLRADTEKRSAGQARIDGTLRQPAAEIVCRGGRVVRVFDDVDASVLACVIRAAEWEATC